MKCWNLYMKLGLALGSLSLFALSSSRAETSVTNGLRKDLTDLSLAELMDIPIYAASKRSQPSVEAPAFVTVVTQDDIRKYGYRTLSDVLRSVPGFYVSSDRTYDYVGARGFSRPSDYNTRILILLNGMRLNDCVYDSSYSDQVFPVDVDLIERVEIVRGPSSSLYGTSAFFGVINVITKTAVSCKGAQVSTELGSLGTTRNRVSYGLKFDGGAALFLSGTLYHDPGQELYFKEFDTPATSNGETPRAADEGRSGNALLNFIYDELTLQAGYSSRTKHVPTAPYETVFAETGTRTVDDESFIDLKIDHTFSEVLQGMARISYLTYGYDGYYAYDYAAAGQPRNVQLSRDSAIGDWWIGELKLSSEVIERNKVTVGTECRLNTRQFQQNMDAGAAVPNVNDDRTSSVLAFYAEDEIRLHRMLLLNAGVRFDHYTTFGGEVNPRFALVCQPMTNTTVKLIYGSAFRAPNVYELYYDDHRTQKGNPALEPETIKTYELILEQKLGGKMKVLVSGYHYNIRDLIDQQIDPSDRMIVYDNVSAATANGMDLALQGRAVNDIDWKASYTLNNTTDDETNERLSNSPRSMVKGNIAVPLFSPKIIGGLEAQYMSSRKSLSGIDAAGFMVLNATVLSRDLCGFEVSLSVYNLLDKEYADPAGAELLQGVVIQDGRTFRVKATYTF